MHYTLHRAETTPPLVDDWEAPGWETAEALDVAHFHARSSDHRPRTQARLLCDDLRLAIRFRVEDRYVRCVHQRYQDSVCQDSCVEFFVQPVEKAGYFNFEFNCGGTLLLSYVEDPTRVDGGFRKWRPVSRFDGERVTIVSSMPARVEPEITEPVTWMLGAEIPYAVFEPYVGPVSTAPGTAWRANFYKCGDRTSHPHWASWAPIGEVLNFHAPQHFGTLIFA